MTAMFKNVNNCNCEISTIVRHINTQVMSGSNNVILNEFESSLKCTVVLNKLNACLKKHGFPGSVTLMDHIYMYSK